MSRSDPREIRVVVVVATPVIAGVQMVAVKWGPGRSILPLHLMDAWGVNVDGGPITLRRVEEWGRGVWRMVRRESVMGSEWRFQRGGWASEVVVMQVSFLPRAWRMRPVLYFEVVNQTYNPMFEKVR